MKNSKKWLLLHKLGNKILLGKADKYDRQQYNKLRQELLKKGVK